jgi:hypothetical protein
MDGSNKKEGTGEREKIMKKEEGHCGYFISFVHYT